MTRMSEPNAVIDPAMLSNSAGLLVGSRLARAVHAPQTIVRAAVLFGLGGCVIPPDLSVDNQDAGQNSPPAILSVRADDSELAEPGPVRFDRGDQSVNVELIDTDVNDVLFIRMFVDYNPNDPINFRAACIAPPDGKPVRSATCNAGGVCRLEDIGATKDLQLQIMVFDREPLDDPPFQDMPPNTGGLKTSRFYFLQCQEPML